MSETTRVKADLEAIFHPRSIAVVGASANPESNGYEYVACLQEFGFKGAIYPVHPNLPELLGLPVYPNLTVIPGPVDYVISCIPAAGVIERRPDDDVTIAVTVHIPRTGNRDAKSVISGSAGQDHDVAVGMRFDAEPILDQGQMGIVFAEQARQVPIVLEGNHDTLPGRCLGMRLLRPARPGYR